MEKQRQAPPPYSDAPGFPNPGYGHQYGVPPQAPSAPPTVIMSPPPVTTTNVVHVSTAARPGCPVCHNNSWTGTYPCCAWCCCIFLFPIGIICCLCMRKKKCTKCGYVCQ